MPVDEPAERQVGLVLADVDGTLVTPDKRLTDATIEAVRSLGAAGIRFAVASGRPPRGLAMLVDPLAIDTPLSGFNGGLVVDRDLAMLEQRLLPAALVPEIAEAIRGFDLDLWCYRGADWLVTDLAAPHVATESAAVQFSPTLVPSLEAAALVTWPVVQLVGVSDDHGAVARAEAAVRERFGAEVSAARATPFYLDVTHPDANKGAVVRHLADRYAISPSRIAAVGDMPTDLAMFEACGLAIAMGNASEDVQRAADHVTASNDADGFALAVERFILHPPRTAT